MKPCKKNRWSTKLICIGISLLLITPALASGYLNDDYFFTDTQSPPVTPFSYYDFFDDDSAEQMPWWMHESFSLRFWRPLASLSLHLDFTLWPDSPIGAHAQSALWLVLMLFGAFRFFEMVLSPCAQKWAGLFFSMGLFHTWAAGWIAARHSIMVAAMLVWAMVAMVMWRETKRRKYEVAFLLLFILSLNTSESGVAFLFAAACFGWLNDSPFRQKLRDLTPVLVIGAVYLTAYVVAGYGARGSGLYVTPFDDPVGALQTVPSKMLALMASFSMGLPAMLRVLPKTSQIPVVAGVICLWIWFGALMLSRANRSGAQKELFRWMIPATFLCMLPEMSGLVEGRGSLLSAIFFCGVAAEILTTLFKQPSRMARFWSYAAGGVLTTGLLLLSPLSRVGASFFIYKGSQALVEGGQQSEVNCPSHGRFFLINADPMMSVMAPFILSAHKGNVFESWMQFTISNSPVQITREGENELIVQSDTGVVDSWLKLYRPSDAPMKAGDTVRRAQMTVKVMEVANHLPTKIKVIVPGDMKNTCFLTAEQHRLITIQLPAVGERITVNWQPPTL
ncbi:MAG: hypothetical protein JXR76_31035 [Deltaproteobacteria bacterium]|nr:hypothetical protein [Deltaproteobacteria bacterium]